MEERQKVEELARKVSRLKDVLSFYARESSWQRSRLVDVDASGNEYKNSEAELDRGKKARAVLGKEEPKVYSDFHPLYDDHAAYWQRRRMRGL